MQWASLFSWLQPWSSWWHHGEGSIWHYLGHMVFCRTCLVRLSRVVMGFHIFFICKRAWHTLGSCLRSKDAPPGRIISDSLGFDFWILKCLRWQRKVRFMVVKNVTEAERISNMLDIVYIADQLHWGHLERFLKGLENYIWDISNPIENALIYLKC